MELKSVSATWFECAVRYDKVMEDGTNKSVTEKYVIDAVSFSEAEERITEEVSAYIAGEFDVKNINLTPFSEVIFDKDTGPDKFFKAKVAFIHIDEHTGKKKAYNTIYLVQAPYFHTAVAYVNDFLKSSVSDFKIVSVTKTSYIEVFQYKEK